MNNKYFLSVLLVLSILSIAAPGKRSSVAASVTVDRVVAVVNGDIITMSDLQREASKSTTKIDDRLLLEDMINRKLQMSAAKRAGMDVTEKELTDNIEEIKKRNSLNQRQFEAELSKEGLTIEQYRVELKEQITLSRMFNKFVRSGVSIDENELKAYYDNNPAAFRLPEEIRIRQILLRFPEGASASRIESVRQKAAEASARASKGEDFVALVHEFSDKDSAVQDGDLGFMRRDHALPEIEQAVAPLKPGGIAGPVRTSLGFHIIRLEEIRSMMVPFDKVRDEISTTLFNQKMESTYRNWLQTLRNESTIENRL